MDLFPITKICSDCKKDLPELDFYRKGRKRDTICKKCKDKRARKWRKGNEKYLKGRRDYMRKSRVSHIKVSGKRLYPSDECCELCRKKVRLVYHHWDDKDFGKGMWICLPCHRGVHWLELFDSKIYFNLKKEIEQGIAKKLRYWEEEK